MSLPNQTDLYTMYDELRTRYFATAPGRYAIPPSSDVRLEWSSRLTASAGKCYLPSKLIRLSTHYHERHPEEIAATLTHEMIHLVVPGHGPAFYAWITHINGLGGRVARYARERATPQSPPKWRYRCTRCALEYPRRRRLDVRRYRCGRCRGPLVQIHPPTA